MEALSDTLVKNGAGTYALAIAVFIAGLVLARVLRAAIDKSAGASAFLKEYKVSQLCLRIVQKNLFIISCFASFYVAVYILYLHPKIERAVDITGLVAVTFFTARIVIELLNEALEHFSLSGSEDTDGAKIPKGVITLVNALVWVLVSVFVLDNLGFNITALVAGVGIGGIAVAMASQAVLGDLFSYFVILFDKPFTVGDYLVVGDKSGAVEHIGIKTTRLKSLTGEELVFSNTDLTNSRVHNYRKMKTRRVSFNIGVKHETPAEELEKIPGIIREIIEEQDGVTFSRSHFATFGEFALVFETVYIVDSADYGKFMDIRQRINLAIKQRFEGRGVSFAYPTQTIHIQTKPGQGSGLDV